MISTMRSSVAPVHRSERRAERRAAARDQREGNTSPAQAHQDQTDQRDRRPANTQRGLADAHRVDAVAKGRQALHTASAVPNTLPQANPTMPSFVSPTAGSALPMSTIQIAAAMMTSVYIKPGLKQRQPASTTAQRLDAIILHAGAVHWSWITSNT
jgi:hypothetical protein